ncbi:MAG: bifunctional hydroxymethylpyrimidine kinase/phosphomethylpyrimidine kinase [Candidatus Sumerlaeia bacterium]
MPEGSYYRALTIAGSDSGGGAGIQADLKTFHSLGVYGMSAVTALTAQNTNGVRSIHSVPSGFLEDQIRAVLDDIGADAVKTGMLESAANVSTTARLLREYGINNVVVDPVMAAKSGDRLLREDAVQAVIGDLFPVALVVTPNLPESEIIINHKVRTIDDMKFVAETLLLMGAKAAVVKGGHLSGEQALDVFYDGSEFEFLESPRLDQAHTHGTGCTFSAAIAAWLARGAPLLEAVRRAKEFVTEAIRHARPLGGGTAPVNHLWCAKGESEFET